MKNQKMFSSFFRKVPESLDAFFRPSIRSTLPSSLKKIRLCP
jgi:hypothetical protein